MTNDELIEYINDCVRNNDKNSNICKMALIAQQAIISHNNYDEILEEVSNA